LLPLNSLTLNTLKHSIIKHILKSLAITLIIAATPLIFLSLLWCLTLGGFDFISVVNSNANIFVTTWVVIIAIYLGVVHFIKED